MKVVFSIIFNSKLSWADKWNSLISWYKDVYSQFKPFNSNEWKDVKIDIVPIRAYTEEEIGLLKAYKISKYKLDQKIMQEYLESKKNANL